MMISSMQFHHRFKQVSFISIGVVVTRQRRRVIPMLCRSRERGERVHAIGSKSSVGSPIGGVALPVFVYASFWIFSQCQFLFLQGCRLLGCG
jgi:hypothetical protein